MTLAGFAIACVSNEATPYTRQPSADREPIERLRIDEEARGPQPVALIAPLEDEDQQTGAEEGTGQGRPGQEGPVETLLLEDLLRSVEEQFPLVLAALEEVEVAAGQLLSTEGRFDARLKADVDLGLQGFYENEQAKVSIEQPTTAWGATVFGGYKLGRGDFPTWEGDLKSQTDGELSAGVRLPLLAGRAIDSNRLALWKARLQQQQATPFVLQKRLEATRKAATSYWKWVAAGQKLEIARRLLSLAEDRQGGLEVNVAEGELPPIVLIENRRLVVERESILVRAERSLQEAAIALSLYWRATDGAPRIPDPESLPEALPLPKDPALLIGEEDTQLALERRPEVRNLELKLEQIELEIRKADNDILPKLDVGIQGSQDFGDEVSDPDDKGPFEFDAYVRFDLPLERRDARGRQQSLGGEWVQAQRKLQLQKDTVVAQVQDSESALRLTWLRLGQVRENVELAGRLEEAERTALREGESDLLRVNLREQQTASAASMLVDVVAEHFRSIAEYRANLGVPYDEVLFDDVP